MAVRKLGKSWWVDMRYNYVRYRKRSPLNTRAGALMYESTLRLKLMRGENINRRGKNGRLDQDVSDPAVPTKIGGGII
jgi:hypothetical protein